MRTLLKNTTLFIVGGITYFLLENLFRGRSHWTMALVGGICFIIIGLLNELFFLDMSLIIQGCIGSIVITTLELISGLIINVWLGLGVWDYSNLPLNFMGQISLLYSLLWIPLSMFAVWYDDMLRNVLFDEAYPKYKIF